MSYGDIHNGSSVGCEVKFEVEMIPPVKIMRSARFRVFLTLSFVSAREAGFITSGLDLLLPKQTLRVLFCNFLQHAWIC